MWFAAVRGALERDRKKDNVIFRGQRLSAGVECNYYPEIRVSMFLVRPEAHAKIHTVKLWVGGAAEHFFRQMMRIRRGKYHHRRCAAHLARQLVGITVRRAGQLTQQQGRLEINAPDSFRLSCLLE